MTMSDAVLNLDSTYFRDLPSVENMTKVRSGDVPTLASKFDLLADIIEHNWTELPVPIKEFAKTYAYHELESGRKASFLDRLRFGWFMFQNLTAKDEVAHLLSAISRLSDAVFSAIERENPEYSEKINQALDSAIVQQSMTAEQFRIWTKSL